MSAIRLDYLERYVMHAPELPEAQARGRRWPAFIKATGLKELRNRAPDFDHEITLDHFTGLTDGRVDFVLTEPYGALEPCIGVVAIKVPTNLSPYCGKWNPKPGSLPWTTSWLYTDQKNVNALRIIEHNLSLAALTAPPWNQL
jgi:hypothetical protein